MARLVECVPNFSEGRDRIVVDALASAIESVAGATLLDVELDADHHRSVVTFAAEPEAALEAAFRATSLARDKIDLRRHKGQHPRMGAVDVIPFVPIEGITLEECAELARRLGRRIGEELGIPVFLYEAAATRPDRENLADVRRGEFEGLAERIGKDPDRVPDFGPSRIHESAGAIAVGARRPLVAFNANLATADVAVAKAIAKSIRFADGGLRYVKALGFAIREGRQAQVSMNLVNTDGTPIHRVLALIDHEARRHGTQVTGCEVVGLVPQAALFDCAEHALRLEGFRRDQVLEVRMGRPPAGSATTVGDFLDRVAEATPTPGGGSVAALAGALAAALVQMVAGLTVGKKKYAEVEPEMRRRASRPACCASAWLRWCGTTARRSRPCSPPCDCPRSPPRRSGPAIRSWRGPIWRRRGCRWKPHDAPPTWPGSRRGPLRSAIPTPSPTPAPPPGWPGQQARGRS